MTGLGLILYALLVSFQDMVAAAQRSLVAEWQTAVRGWRRGQAAEGCDQSRGDAAAAGVTFCLVGGRGTRRDAGSVHRSRGNIGSWMVAMCSPSAPALQCPSAMLWFEGQRWVV